MHMQVSEWTTSPHYRLTKLAKEHGVPLWEEAVSTAGDSDAESFGQPVSNTFAVKADVCEQ